MACAVAFPVLAPSGDFPAWLEAQGVNAEVARAMDSELGIRDYGVLRACVGDGLVRAELLATARDRLPFGFYAVLRQVVKALQGADTHDGGTTPGWDAAAVSSPGDVTLGGLVNVLLTLFSGLSQELLQSMQRMQNMDNNGTWAVGSPLATSVVLPENSAKNEVDDYTVNDNCGENLMPDIGDPNAVDTSSIKTEADEGPSGIEANSGLIMQDVVLRQQMELHCTNTDKVSSCSHLQQHQYQQSTACEMERNLKVEEIQDTSLGVLHSSNSPKTRHCHWQQEPPNGIEDFPSREQNPAVEKANPSDNQLDVLRSLNASSTEVNVNEKSEKKAHECVVCKKNFAWRSLLGYHSRTHTGEKPYRCRLCNQSFAQRGNLKAHERIHTGDRPYRCDICNGSFSRSPHLKHHLRTHKSLEEN